MPARDKLSDRQKEILAFIGRFTAEKKRPPTIREIGEAAKISSTSVVNYNLNILEKHNHIVREAGVSRGVRLGNTPEARQAYTPTTGLMQVPLMGYIVASAPAQVDTTPDGYVEVSRELLPDAPGDLFALRVRGDSMIDAMVNDGDIVVLRKVDRARNGDMVAVWLNDRQETTLKYFYNENGRVRLQPANPTLQPIYIENRNALEVHGKVVMVMRTLS